MQSLAFWYLTRSHFMQILLIKFVVIFAFFYKKKTYLMSSISPLLESQKTSIPQTALTTDFAWLFDMFLEAVLWTCSQNADLKFNQILFLLVPEYTSSIHQSGCLVIHRLFLHIFNGLTYLVVFIINNVDRIVEIKTLNE